MPKRKDYEKVVVDACLVRSEIHELLKQYQLDHNDILYLAEICRDASDEEIIKYILSRNRLLITKDRVLHNAIIKVGHSRFYETKTNTLTTKRLSMVKARRITKSLCTSTIKRLYVHQPAQNMGWYNPPKRVETKVAQYAYSDNMTQKRKSKTKRARIKHYFNGHKNISDCRVFITVYQDLIGASIVISSHKSKKTKTLVSEFYTQHQGEKIKRRAVYYVLTYLLRLRLHNQKIILFYDYPIDTSRPYYKFISSDFSQICFSRSKPNMEQIRRIRGPIKKIKTRPRDKWDLTEIDLVQTYKNYLRGRKLYNEYLERLTLEEKQSVA